MERERKREREREKKKEREREMDREKMRARVAGEEKVVKSAALCQCVNRRFRRKESRKKRGPVRELTSPELRKLACSRRLVGAGSEHARSAPGLLARQHRGFARFELRGRRSILARSGADFVAGAALSQGRVQISWQAQHFRKVNFSLGLTCVAGATLSKGQAQISWQVQHLRKVRYRFRGRHSTFARSSKDFVAVQHFRKVMCIIRGRHSTFASLGTHR